MCVGIGCMLPVYKFLSFYYYVCLLLLCFFVVFFSFFFFFFFFFCIYVLLCISFNFIFLGKGLILLFCIFSCNFCPFLSRLFFFVVYLWCICLVISVNKLEVWWQYLPPTLEQKKHTHLNLSYVDYEDVYGPYIIKFNLNRITFKPIIAIYKYKSVWILNNLKWTL